MTGQTYLILRDLENSISVRETAEKFHKDVHSIYKLAKRHGISLPERQLLSEDEKRSRKLKLDARRYSQKRLKALLDPNTAMPTLPIRASKFGALSSLTAAWQLKQSNKRSSHTEHKATQIKYGLRTRLIGR